MAKKDTVREIAEKFGADTRVSEALSQAQLDELLNAPDKAAFDALLAPPEGAATQTATVTDGEAKPATETKPEPELPEGYVRVRVGPGTAKAPVSPGAGFVHPTARRLIHGTVPVAVPDDAWTQDQLARKVLVEVR